MPLKITSAVYFPFRPIEIDNECNLTNDDSIVDENQVSILDYQNDSTISLGELIHNDDEFNSEELFETSSESLSSDDTDSTSASNPSRSDSETEETISPEIGRGRGRGHGRGRGRGRGIGRCRGVAIRRTRRVQSSQDWRQQIPSVATSIEITDNYDNNMQDFEPMRVPGPQNTPDSSPLSLFNQFFDDSTVDRMVEATNGYAEAKKTEKAFMYKLYRSKPLDRDEMRRYLGVLILLGINKMRNYSMAWNYKTAQHLPKLVNLMTRHRFEAISSFFHLVTPEEEAANSTNPLKKVLPLYNHLKKKCFDLYQPLQELSIDERMVKSKARTFFRQYIRNKPHKWGFKLWVVADPTGYTVDFDIYCGARHMSSSSGKGLAYDVVVKLVQPFLFQGYLLFCDNFYTSPQLFQDLLKDGILATGTLNVGCQGVPQEVKQLKQVLENRNVPRGTGFYYREPSSPIVYCCWKDSKTVTVTSTRYHGHSKETIKRRTVDPDTNTFAVRDIPIPDAIR